MIPVNEPLLDGDEIQNLQECITTGWISSEGSFVKKLENQFSERVGRKYGIAVTNGSAALETAFAAIGIKEGDEVIVPTFTIISCLAPIIRMGATPVLIDVDENNWNMAASEIEAKITSKTKAILVVHIYGLPCDMDIICALTKKFNLYLIEDAAQAIGQKFNNRPCGSFGDISTFSFYPNKLLTTGEGGMLVTNNEELSLRCKKLRNLCFEPPRRFVHEELGWNFRMTNIQAAIGVAQLERLDSFIERKISIGNWYNELFKDCQEYLQLPLKETNYAKNQYWVYGIVLKSNVSFNAIHAMKRLSELGIGTRPFFYPMNKQPVFNKVGLFTNENYPKAEFLAERGLYLPSGLTLTREKAIEVSEKVKLVLNENL